MSGGGSGRRSRQAWRAKMLRSRPACRRRSEHDGSGRQAAWHQRCSGRRQSRSPAAIFRLRSVRRSRFCGSQGHSMQEIGASARTGSVDDLPGVAAQRRHPQRWPGVSRDDGAVARRAIGPPAEAGEACAQCGLARLCGGTSGRRGRRSKRRRCSWPAVSWKGRRHGPRQDRRWARAWSPEQIARRLPVDFPDDVTMRISHEAIYQALFVQGRGALRRELTACLRTGRALRVPRARTRGEARASSRPRS